ncbi:hypothetical protein BDA96_05G166500 [Sorghum bicolor]|uniref:Uncharacterized protein n=3 Tax=Sorghum bicolor TaxID=4558 RepID=A0A921UFP1_SORBI|nr:hypothetical protein BDA96_05G166500 [Sorghum bicolor]OQU83645.1 hypothetical protein SORBI_3005G152550 [Sorghum bicolor]
MLLFPSRTARPIKYPSEKRDVNSLLSPIWSRPLQSGASMEGRACAVTNGNSSHASKLDCPLSKRDDAGVFDAFGQIEVSINKASQVTLLNLMSNKGEHFLYQTGPDWKKVVVPEEAKALFLEGDNLEKVVMERKWNNLSDDGEAWGM